MRASLVLMRWLPLAAVLAAPSCKDVTPGQETDTTQGDESGTTFLPATMGDGTAVNTTVVLDDDGSGGPQGGGECDYFEQDCREGEKCTPWSEMADLVPDESRCCPVKEPVAQTGDLCMVEGYLGSCVDNCAPGNICLDIDGDGQGVCQDLCGGTAENPICPDDDECFVYFGGVPLCFAPCDPLVQDCPGDKGCYPDAIAEGGTGWLCMPTIGDNQLGDYCWLLAGCNPGMICATPPLLPECYGDADDAGCCTDICDITEQPDPCTEIHPDLECIAWYFDGESPPMAGLENVGACVLPNVGGGA
ncbi:MAG: hypothetical protein KDK70_24795 [Myxococcales bacterium]|nr:hypothetical protein [Myxococcales bacterium]